MDGHGMEGSEIADTAISQDAGIVRTWGAAVLRPYMIFPGLCCAIEETRRCGGRQQRFVRVREPA
jgi:hypothetical protein